MAETIAGLDPSFRLACGLSCQSLHRPDIVGLSYTFSYRPRHDDEPAGLGTMLIFLLIDGHMP